MADIFTKSTIWFFFFLALINFWPKIFLEHFEDSLAYIFDESA